ncbi:fas apoptotic inhibitory molecule 1, partial [Biomphalaria pfeifferi]
MSDLVATWEIALSDGVHIVEFEHGTTTGKRIIRIDGKEIYRQDWMFKLVGKEHFQVGKAKCVITIEAVSGFSYEYTLDVNGKPLKKFIENQSKV